MNLPPITGAGPGRRRYQRRGDHPIDALSRQIDFKGRWHACARPADE
jgi:hypothetical protein